jgi:uncharacterized protein (TIGR03000 family)
LGVWPGDSFAFKYGVGNFGYPNRLNFGYANRNFALGVGIGNPLYRGFAGYPGHYGYPTPWLTAGAGTVFVPYYVPVPTGPAVPPGGDLVPAVPPGQVQAEYRPAIPPTPTAGAARITVQVPAGAQLFVDDQPTAQTGAVREFVTPATLEPGRNYQYKLRAQWQQNGQTVTRERTVEFKADSSIIVNFNVESQ